MSFTNTSPITFPTRSAVVAIGTDPLSVAAPGTRTGDSFVLDMATSTVALGKVEIAHRRGETEVPRGWIADKNGRETTRPELALGTSGGGLLPLGGVEETGGYKGYGLNMMAEMFCGILSGASWGPHVRKWMSTERVANLVSPKHTTGLHGVMGCVQGQCFVAIDPSAFAPGFAERMQEYMDTMRALPPVRE
jgi:LDH2 family malate/lactate/ureidoglycolate dehydrogenase